MRPYSKARVVLLLLLVAGASVQATTRKVLFIGNSYTYTNNMPLMLQTLATAMGDTLIYDESDPGGYTFEQHSVYGPTISKIFSQQWDIVVLQEQSQLPSFPSAEVDTEVYPYAHILDSMVHKNDTCTQTMFLMTWGHANGDPMNCPDYPAICTYDGMQYRLRQSYLQMTQDNHVIVAPVGAAWKVVHDSFVAPWLFISDSSHPLVAGSYLEACVLYSSIFHKRTLGCSSTSGLSTTDATILQRIGDRVVMDSLTQWQQYGHYPNAGFDFTQVGNTVTTSHANTIPVNYTWDFGDGVTDTASTPPHTYSSNGVYTIAHTAYNECFSETIKEVVRVGATTGVNTYGGNSAFAVTTMLHGNGCISFVMPGNYVFDFLEVYDAAGRCVRHYTLNGQVVNDQLAPGFYMISAFSQNKNIVFNNKLIVY